MMALGASLTGCLGPVPIVLPAISTAAAPAQGASVGVMISDERSEKSPARIGILVANDRDFVLEGDPLATRLEDELVAALRTRGYRAEHAREGHPPYEVSVLVRVVRFAADVPASRKVRFRGHAVLVAQATTRDAASPGWTDIIDTRDEIALGDFTRLEAMRKLVEQFVRKAVADLVDRVSAGLSPPRSAGGS